MILCPECGGQTEVVETRGARSGLRRRRHCVSGCGGRLTTIEIPVPSRSCAGSEVCTLIPVRELEAIIRAVQRWLPAGNSLGTSVGGADLEVPEPEAPAPDSSSKTGAYDQCAKGDSNPHGVTH